MVMYENLRIDLALNVSFCPELKIEYSGVSKYQEVSSHYTNPSRQISKSPMLQNSVSLLDPVTANCES